MIEHLRDHALGLAHLLFSLAAIVLGAAVIGNRKGTATHRRIGRGYLLAMLSLNLTALSIHELYGRFGPFHWLALFSLATLVAGYVPVLTRSRGWLPWHAYCMSGSYVGVVAAGVAETASRVPGWSFGPSVLVASAVVIVSGLWLMSRAVPRLIVRLSAPDAAPSGSD